MKKPIFKQIDGNSSGYFMLLALLGAFVLAAIGSHFYMEHGGHYVTGMSNQIVWGMPHVFAVFLKLERAACPPTQQLSRSARHRHPQQAQLVRADGSLNFRIESHGQASAVGCGSVSTGIWNG